MGGREEPKSNAGKSENEKGDKRPKTANQRGLNPKVPFVVS